METDHNISDKCIVLLSGIPGSGKSTLANILQEQLKDFWVKLNNESDCDNQLGCSINVVTIPYDELIPDHIVVHDESHQTWRKYREEIVESVEKLLLGDVQNLLDENHIGSGENSSDDNVTGDNGSGLWFKVCELVKKQIIAAERMVIVIDDNMFYSSMRYRYYQLARKYTCGFCQLYIQCDVHLAQQRNAQRPNPIPLDIIVRMAKKIEQPNNNVNSWEVNSLVINGQGIENYLPAISSLIWQAMLNPIQPLEEIDPAAVEESRRISLNNAIHQSDQILRKIISQKMADLKNTSSDKATLQRLSKRYIEVRKTCMEKVKSGNVSFPVAVDQGGPPCDVHTELYQQILRLFELILKEVT